MTDKEKTLKIDDLHGDELKEKDLDKVVGGYKDGEDGVNRTGPGAQ